LKVPEIRAKRIKSMPKISYMFPFPFLTNMVHSCHHRLLIGLLVHA